VGLSLFSFLGLGSALADAKNDLAQTQAKETLTKACQTYALKHDGKFPNSLEDLLRKDGRGGPYLDDRDALLDPWGIRFQYDRAGPRNSGRRPDIWTRTPDGVEIGNCPLKQ
jgi:hypothetical protein